MWTISLSFSDHTTTRNAHVTRNNQAGLVNYYQTLKSRSASTEPKFTVPEKSSKATEATKPNPEKCRKRQQQGTTWQWTVHMARMEESGATVPTRTAQDTFEETIPNKTVGSAVRLERPQRSNTQLYIRKSKLEKHVCLENLYTPNRWSFSFAGTLKRVMGNNDNVNVTGSKHDYRMSTLPKPKANMKTWVQERHLLLAWIIRRHITTTYTITAFRNRKIWLMRHWNYLVFVCSVVLSTASEYDHIMRREFFNYDNIHRT